MAMTRSAAARWIVLLAAVASLTIAAAPSTTLNHVPGRTMGTYVHVTLVTADSAASAPLAAHTLAVFRRVDSLMSNWTTTSEVARLNREAAAGPVTVHPEVAQVLSYALELYPQTDKTFDITVEPLVRAWGFLGGRPHVPSDSEAAAAFRRVGASQVKFDPVTRSLRFENAGVRIDLGGIAKGWAVDVAAETLRVHGVHDALVDLTGNMVAMGHPATATGWRIGVRDPRDRVPYFARLTLLRGDLHVGQVRAVRDRGRSRLRPHHGPAHRPAGRGLISVTLVSKSAFTCDAWDTPLFVLGVARAVNWRSRIPSSPRSSSSPAARVSTPSGSSRRCASDSSSSLRLRRSFAFGISRLARDPAAGAGV
jgi:thiamine biosynthesis lipoprotein